MILTLNASCTVEYAERIRQTLLEALARDTETTLDFRGVSDVDMSFFQLLVSARRSFARAGKRLTFTATLDPNVAQKARIAGIAALAALEAQTDDFELYDEDDGIAISGEGLGQAKVIL